MRLIPRKGDRWYRFGVNNDMEMDLELARRFGFFTLRGGLLEGGFGMGVDVDPVNWLSLSGEVLDFSAGTLPDLRAGLRVYPFFDPESDRPWHWLYVSGGMTRILDDTRSVYLGAGLRFADSEVRSLIGLVPYVVK
jgi:phospholipid/cholesterol/gamma-HCH transport system substrate-binding protein